MKKILIFLFAAILFAACNNDKGKNAQNTTNREKDDYNERANSKSDSDKNAGKTDYSNNKGNNNSDDGKNSNDNNSSDNYSNRNNDNQNKNDSWGSNNSSQGWSSKDVREFVDNCITEAEKGMSSKQAYNYCSCMQVKLEKLYPDSRDAGALTSEDMKTPSMKRMVQDCLTGH